MKNKSKNDAGYPKIVFDKVEKVIDIYPDSSFVYTVDLRTCRSASQLLDWIIQLNDKPWATGDLLKKFLKVLDESCRKVFCHNMKSLYCSGGNTVKWYTCKEDKK